MLQLNTHMKMREVTKKPVKPLTPEQARLKALKDQAKRSQAAVKAERARQQVRVANLAVSAATSPDISEAEAYLGEASRILTFEVLVRVQGPTGQVSCKTEIRAENAQQARIISERLFGVGNTYAVRQIIN